MVRHHHHFAFALRIVLDNQFHRIDHRHRARGVFVQIFTNAGLQRRHLDGVVLLGHADALAELADGFGGVAATTQTGDGRHTRVVPAFHVLLSHQLVQLTLGHHGVFEIQAREFVLTRMHRDADVVQHPIVQAAVVLELQGTQRVGNAFQRIADAVGEVVHRVDAPLVASLMMLSELNAVQHRIAHHDERRRHIDLRAQAGLALFEAAAAHFFEQRQVFFHAAVAIRAVFTRRFQGAAVFANFIRREFINIGQTFVDQLNRILMQLIEIIRRVANVPGPVET